MNRRAFTLMELLVVIGIILVLMGILVPAVGMARRAAQRAKTTAAISALATAIDQYRGLNAVYPEYFKVPAAASLTADQQLAVSRSTWLQTLTQGDEVFAKAFGNAGPPATANPATGIGLDVWEGINVFLVYQLGSLISDTAKDGKVLDTWGTPLRYRPSKWYPYAHAAGTKPRIDDQEPPGQDSYQLWSAGIDKVDDADPGEGGDDMPLWAKKNP